MPLAHLTYEPAEPVSGTVIWMHGLGASCSDFVPLLPFVQRPGVRFIFPQAPDRAVTVNGGERMPAWYDIRTMEESSYREDLEQVEQSQAQIIEIIEAQEAAGISSQNIILAGFSQGAAMALWTAHRYPRQLKAMLILSGYLLAPERHREEEHAANRTTPVLCMHGLQDQVVNATRGEHAFEVLKQTGRAATWRDYPMGHELCGGQARDLQRWFAKTW